MLYDGTSPWIQRSDGGAGAMAFRAALVLGTCVAAITVPNLGDLIDIVGSAFASWIALVLPALFDLICAARLRGYHLSRAELCTGVLVLVGSMVGMVAGTWTSTARILALWFHDADVERNGVATLELSP